MQNPEFLHSLLSSLPGVNPDEAMHNLGQMTDQDNDNKVGMINYYTHSHDGGLLLWLCPGPDLLAHVHTHTRTHARMHTHTHTHLQGKDDKSKK